MKNIILLALGGVLLLGSCKKEKCCEDTIKNKSKLAISFEPKFNNMTLQMNTFGHTNIHDEDVSFNSWGIIMSDVSLIKNDNSKVKLGDGYMYVNLASANPSFSFSDIPDGQYKGISYNIGVDSTTNHSDPTVWGPTHPLNISYTGMHWGWAGGYIFHTMEGKYKPKGSTTESGFSYHTATDILLSSHTYLMNFSLNGEESKTATIEANAEKLFENGLSLTTMGTNHSGSNEQKNVMQTLIGNMKNVYILTSVN